MDGLVQGYVSDRHVVERCLPAYLLYLLMETLKVKHGYEVRDDVLKHLNTASVAPLARHPEEKRLKLAKRIDRDARSLIQTMNADDLKIAVVAVSKYTLWLVESGLYPDQGNQAVLYSSEILLEAEDDSSEWGAAMKRSKFEFEKLQRASQLLGYWVQPTPLEEDVTQKIRQRIKAEQAALKQQHS